MVVEGSDKDLNKQAEQMMAQLKHQADVNTFTKFQFCHSKAQGTLDIAPAIEKLCHMSFSASLISHGSERTGDHVKQWQYDSSQPLFPIAYVEC